MSAETNIHSWYALKVNARSELKASASLVSRGFQLFTPVLKETKSYCDRVRTIERALFPGYIFCRFDAHRKTPIISSPAVQYIVSFSGVPAAVPDETIDAIQRAVEAGGQSVPYVEIGQEICITSGALSGLRGVLLRNEKRDRILVSVHLLQRSVAVEIDRTSYQMIA